MATEIKLPRLGQGMEAGTIVRWLKSEGDAVEKGEPLYELDTDKVTQEVEAEASGVLLKIAVEEGEVPVGRTIAVIGEQGENVAIEEQEGADGAPKSAEKPAEPLARRIARERGIDISSLSGTGPEGRIVAEDVERAAAAPAQRLQQTVTSAETVPLTSVRRTIARRLTEAWQAPVFQLTVTADMTRALEGREQLVELYPEQRPTLSDLLTKLAAVGLMRHRDVNVHFAGDTLVRFGSAHVGIAVATDRGLLVPVIRDCERKTVAEIAADRADLVGRARAGKLTQAD